MVTKLENKCNAVITHNSMEIAPPGPPLQNNVANFVLQYTIPNLQPENAIDHQQFIISNISPEQKEK